MPVEKKTPVLQICNRQKTRRINLRLFRQWARFLADELASARGGALCFHLVAADEMASINETFLGHSGSTDVITFDYREDAGEDDWSGEIFICVDDAVAAAPRFRVPWQAELARYLAHSLLHLQGYDDVKPSARRAMKKEENRLVKTLTRRFDLTKLERSKNVERRK